MKRYFYSILVILCASIFLTSSTDSNVAAASCSQVKIIFARGSSQDLNALEFSTFKARLLSRLGSIDSSVYELGSASQNGHRYPALDVGNVWNGNALGAWVSAGKSYDYGNSVREGQLELVNYLKNLYAQCPSTKIVLGGYSQGAQVIGDAFSAIPKTIENQIVFTALFGDPKLNLPEGKGFFPPACAGRNLSVWRRDIGSCLTNAGSLRARQPYLPKEMEQKTGLWCEAKDFVCGSSSFIWDQEGHGNYAIKNGAIDKAVREIARRLEPFFNRESDENSDDPSNLPANNPVDTRPRVDLGDAAGADVMFVIDVSGTTSSLGYDRSPYFNFIDAVHATQGRVGLLSYCGCDESTLTYFVPIDSDQPWWYPRAIISGMEFDRTVFNITDDMQKALNSVKTTTNWRPGVKHIVAVLTNAPYSPSIARTTATLAKARLASVDPSEQPSLHFLTSASTLSSYTGVSIPGFTVRPPRLAQEGLTEIISHLDAQIEAELANASYFAQPHTTLTFDASASTAYHDTISQYRWDFDGDGSYDQTTTDPVVTHTYSHDFDGTLSLEVITESGLTDTTTAQVDIRSTLPAKPAAPQSLMAQATSEKAVSLTWSTDSRTAGSWLVYLNETSLGYLPAEQSTLTVGDVDFDQPNVFAVQYIDTSGQVSDPTYAVPSLSHNTASTVNDSIPPSPPKATLALAPNKNFNVLATAFTASPRQSQNHTTQSLLSSLTAPVTLLGLLLLALAAVLTVRRHSVGLLR